MGFFDAVKLETAGKKAYRTHVNASQLRKKRQFQAAQTEFEKAEKQYEEAYALGCRTARMLSSYAILLMRFGKFDKAASILQEAFKAPDITADLRWDVRVDFSICQWKLGNLEKAIESIRRAAQIKENSQIYATLGMFLIDKARMDGDFEELKALNERAMDYDDEDAAVLDNIGQMYMAMSEKASDPSEAAALLDQALEYEKKANAVKPEQTSSAYFTALLLHQRGENAEAGKVLSRLDGIPLSHVSQISQQMVDELNARIKGV